MNGFCHDETEVEKGRNSELWNGFETGRKECRSEISSSKHEKLLDYMTGGNKTST